jgi:hypothetical protein
MENLHRRWHQALDRAKAWIEPEEDNRREALGR